MTDSAIEELISDVLRAGPSKWPAAVSPVLAEKIVFTAELHGVAPLLSKRSRHTDDIPECLRELLHRSAIKWAAREIAERNSLAPLIAGLENRGIRPLLFKGVALAHLLYSDPALRPRADADVLIRPGDRLRTIDALADLGWEPRSGSGGAGGQGEASYVSECPGGLRVHLDLHWRISNSHLLCRLFSFEELMSRSVALTSLHPRARATCPVDALLIGCMHRLVHLTAPIYLDGSVHFLPDRLIWLEDIRLLAASLSARDWAEVQERARSKGLASVCRDGLIRACTILGARVPESVMGNLEMVEGAELPAKYLQASWSGREWMDFRAVDGWSSKLGFIVENLVPSPVYMRDRYGHSEFRWLPWLYLRRAIGGIRKRLRGRPENTDAG